MKQLLFINEVLKEVEGYPVVDMTETTIEGEKFLYKEGDNFLLEYKGEDIYFDEKILISNIETLHQVAFYRKILIGYERIMEIKRG